MASKKQLQGTIFTPGRRLSRNSASKSAPKINLLKIKSAVVIPTYCPSIITYKLINSLIKWNPKTKIVVVDDSTPLTKKNLVTIDKIKKLASSTRQLRYLRTPENTLKAGALNFGINHLLNHRGKPEVIFTFDDDVKINSTTLNEMIKTLFSENHVGAVCSLALVENKNVNVLTRLQSLEYHSFNFSKIADNNFLRGPLVMHGMLSAFRVSALKQVSGFTPHHLIEDYEITVRIKNKGWKVKIAQHAQAWTDVPENIEALWKQRVRWSYGGVGVVLQYWRSLRAIFQDLIGHIFFLTLLGLIIFSLTSNRDGVQNPQLVFAITAMAILNFVVAFTINTLMLLSYPRRDKTDWALKLTFLPELIYCNILSLILVGSYLFLMYNLLGQAIIKRFKFLTKAHRFGLLAFQKVGYSSTWGTRQ